MRQLNQLGYSTKPCQVVAFRNTGRTMLGFALQAGWEELLPTGHKGLGLALRVGLTVNRSGDMAESSSAIPIMTIATVSA